MPSVDIETSTDGRKKYVEPHERKNGPWEDYELSHAAESVEHAEKVKANPKFSAAVVKHVEQRAKKHAKTAQTLRHHMKRGSVSERQFEKAKAKNG